MKASHLEKCFSSATKVVEETPTFSTMFYVTLASIKTPIKKAKG